MNRERLTILRDHLAALPDERVHMNYVRREAPCGTVACIGGWAGYLSAPDEPFVGLTGGGDWLDLDGDQRSALFWPNEVFGLDLDELTRSDAIAAIQSMLDSPDDDALPVWPSREGASA